MGRAKRSVRYDPDNGAGLCRACHMYFGAHPLEHVEWFKQRLGDKFDLLQARARQVYPKPDKKLIELYLKEMIRKLT